jgi:hypothetical protein
MILRSAATYISKSVEYASDFFFDGLSARVYYIKKLTNGTKILERGLPIFGLRPNHVCEVSR